MKSKTPKHKTPQPKGKTQILQPDLRLTIPRTAKQQRKGKSPTETTTKKICQGHSGKNPLCRNRLKNMQQNELVATQSGETRKRQKKQPQESKTHTEKRKHKTKREARTGRPEHVQPKHNGKTATRRRHKNDHRNDTPRKQAKGESPREGGQRHKYKQATSST